MQLALDDTTVLLNEFSPLCSLSHTQPPMQVKGLDGLLRTSLDLELDLQVTRTRHSRLNEELRVLRELKEQLENARQQGQHVLPTWVQEDERFRLLLKHAERQVSPITYRTNPQTTCHPVQHLILSCHSLLRPRKSSYKNRG